MVRHRCWTCKDRKVRCDGRWPTCINCTRVGRRCQGYGLRLSWPSSNNQKRAMTFSPRKLHAVRSVDPLYLVNATELDMKLRLLIRDSRYTVSWDESEILLAKHIIPKHIEDLRLGDSSEQERLFSHFTTVSFNSLATFSLDQKRIRDLVMRMALLANTPASKGIWYALMAYGSLHRYGLQSQALSFKISCINVLTASATSGITDMVVAAQHVTAGMLLSSFEARSYSASAGQWLYYIDGAKDVIQAAALERHATRDQDIAELLHWVYYHDVLSRFSRQHWRRPASEQTNATQLSIEHETRTSHTGNFELSPPLRSNQILDLLSEAIDIYRKNLASQRANRSREFTPDQASSLNTLIPEMNEAIRNGRHKALASRMYYDMYPNEAQLVEIYQLATLVYTSRLIESISGIPQTVERLLDRAFHLLGRMEYCQRFFPVFIVGCEAHDDLRRTMILALVDRTERKFQVGRLVCLRDALRTAWVQNDLAADEDLVLKYTDKISAVLSAGGTLPSLV